MVTMPCRRHSIAGFSHRLWANRGTRRKAREDASCGDVHGSGSKSSVTVLWPSCLSRSLAFTLLGFLKLDIGLGSFPESGISLLGLPQSQPPRVRGGEEPSLESREHEPWPAENQRADSLGPEES